MLGVVYGLWGSCAHIFGRNTDMVGGGSTTNVP